MKLIVYLISVLHLLAVTQSEPECSTYKFLNEPPEEIPCNPYLDPSIDDIKLKCSITGPKLHDDNEVNIGWFRTLNSEQTVESLGGVKDNNMVAIETIVATNDGDEIIISSVLTVKDTLPNNVAGRYWCVATVSLGNNSRGNVVEIQSEMSTITMIRTIGELQDDERRCNSVILTTISTECVYFEPSNFYSLPRPLVPGPTEGPVMTTDRTTLARQDSPTVSDDNVILSSTTIIILSVVGGTLCIVIHILLAMVGCLCNRSRKRGQPRVRKGTLDSRKVSTISLIMSSPESQSRPYTPDEAEPTSGNITPPNATACPLKHLPPVPTNKPPLCPSNPGKRTRPSRLSHQVNLISSNKVESNQHEELYASLQAARHEQRAATFAGEHIICVTPNSDSSSNFDTDPKYKSLNRDMMDKQPMYEDPQMSGMQREGYWESDEEDGDQDSLYTATILQNTGRKSMDAGTVSSNHGATSSKLNVGTASSKLDVGVASSKLDAGVASSKLDVGIASSNYEVASLNYEVASPSHNVASSKLDVCVASEGSNIGVKTDADSSSMPLSPAILCPSPLSSNQHTSIPVPIRRNQNVRALSPAPIPRKFNKASSPSPSPRAQSHISLQLPILRGQNPIPVPNLVPLSRASIDGEYVLPNEAYDGGILSPTEELSGKEQPDYIDIA